MGTSMIAKSLGGGVGAAVGRTVGLAFAGAAAVGCGFRVGDLTSLAPRAARMAAPTATSTMRTAISAGSDTTAALCLHGASAAAVVSDHLAERHAICSPALRRS